MNEVTIEAGGGQEPAPTSVPKNGKGMVAPSPVLDNGATEMFKSRDTDHNEYEEIGEMPSRFEVWVWYLYELCSYFVQTVLIPVVFPLIISQLQQLPTDTVQDWVKNHQGMACAQKEIHLYSTLTTRTIRVNGSNFSSLEWTSIAWAGGLALAAPILGFISFHLDGQFQTLITAASTGVGVFFCLPAGFFKTTKIFIPYIAGIVVASTVASAAHTQHLGLMIRAFGGPILKKSQFSTRQRVSSWLSLYATVAGYFGAAIISSFTYYMVKEPNEGGFLSLWIVSIFSGLIWLVGLLHAVTAPNRANFSMSFSSMCWFHPFSIFKYTQAIGGLVGVFLSSFSTMSIFTGGVLFIVGNLCITPKHLLYFWLTYFIFPLFSLPLLIQPLQHLIKASSVKMKIMGFLLSLLSSGFGFYFWDSYWKWGHILIFGAIQGTANGVLHAFGRVMVMDCAPSGKEGAFSVWYAWVRSIGLCVGFAVGSVVPGHIRTSLGAAFCTALVGIIVLLFGNVSDVDGAVAAGYVREDSVRGSHDPTLDSKESVIV